MSDSPKQDELLSMINLLAGAAQAGATGIVAQAALNLVLASEAYVKATKLNLDQKIQDTALKMLNDTRDALDKASGVKGALEEAKQDLAQYGKQPYQPMQVTTSKK